MGVKLLTLLAIGVFAVSAFSGNDEKFIKKYAMMKIYESCFGAEVVKQIREEMKIAVAKCAAMEMVSPFPEEMQINPTQAPPPAHASISTSQEPISVPHKSVPMLPNTIVITAQPVQHEKQGPLQPEEQEQDNAIKANFDPEKLHQAILAYRPNPFQPTFRPYQSPQNSFYPGYNNPGFANPAFAAPGPYNFYQGNPGFQSPLPYTAAYPQYPQFFQQPFFSGQRMSRDFDVNAQADILKSRLSGKVRNVTCVMQELGYLNENLEPTYDKIISKIDSLPIQDELKRDIEDGIDFCKQFSQCIPESQNDRSPFSNELIRPMFFFRCYKHKKLEACIMKDVRDRFTGLTEDSLDAIPEPDILRRNGKSAKISNEENDLASSIFEFLYGNDSMNLDAVL